MKISSRISVLNSLACEHAGEFVQEHTWENFPRSRMAGSLNGFLLLPKQMSPNLLAANSADLFSYGSGDGKSDSGSLRAKTQVLAGLCFLWNPGGRLPSLPFPASCECSQSLDCSLIARSSKPAVLPLEYYPIVTPLSASSFHF